MEAAGPTYESECPACSHQACWDGRTKEEGDWFFFHMECSVCSNAFWESNAPWEREYRAGLAPKPRPPREATRPPARERRAIPATFEALRSAALEPTDFLERREAMEGLAALRDPRAVEVLAWFLRAPADAIESDPGSVAIVRLDAIMALGRLGHPEAVEPLCEVLAWPFRGDREAAAVALGKIGDPRAVTPLVGILSDPDEWVRKAAAISLGQIGDPSAAEPLRKLLQDPSEWVRPNVGIVLGEMGDPEALEVLLEALHHVDHERRERAARALGVLGEGRASQALIALAGDDGSSYQARANAAVALGCIGDPRAPALLRRSVERGVGFLAPPQAADRLRRWIAYLEGGGLGSRIIPCPASSGAWTPECGDPAPWTGAVDDRGGWFFFEFQCPSCHYRWWQCHLRWQREQGSSRGTGTTTDDSSR